MNCDHVCPFVVPFFFAARPWSPHSFGTVSALAATAIPKRVTVTTSRVAARTNEPPGDISKSSLSLGRRFVSTREPSRPSPTSWKTLIETGPTGADRRTPPNPARDCRRRPAASARRLGRRELDRGGKRVGERINSMPAASNAAPDFESWPRRSSGYWVRSAKMHSVAAPAFAGTDQIRMQLAFLCSPILRIDAPAASTAACGLWAMLTNYFLWLC